MKKIVEENQKRMKKGRFNLSLVSWKFEIKGIYMMMLRYSTLQIIRRG